MKVRNGSTPEHSPKYLLKICDFAIEHPA